jgi:NAD(P)-dependent dehydrogenase (short-subunit alcohol dehydrogenase family)
MGGATSQRFAAEGARVAIGDMNLQAARHSANHENPCGA